MAFTFYMTFQDWLEFPISCFSVNKPHPVFKISSYTMTSSESMSFDVKGFRFSSKLLDLSLLL